MKRIIVCCDGTWMDSDGGVQVPSNVTRIARAIKPTATLPDGTEITQTIYYENGIGTGTNSIWDHYVSGATGEGLAEHIREAYSFICLNYEYGDEIFLLGFSRGAFTARSISTLIRAIGLLTTKGLQYFIQIFEDWQFQLKEGWTTSYPTKPWAGHKPPVDSEEYQRQLVHHELSRPNIPIKAVGVWDTVGGLGIPMVAIFPQPPSTDFSFVDTKVEPNIEYAFQALALDEHRRSYRPTVWEKPSSQPFPRILKQCWFPGVHSDIGGSYPDTDLANLTLAWMVSQLDPLLSFSHDYVWTQVRLSIDYHEEQRQKLLLAHLHNPLAPIPPPLRPWGLGKIHNSMTLFFRLGGSLVRTPNEYTGTEKGHQHGQFWWFLSRTVMRWARIFGLFKPKKMPRLENTNESIHASVRIRMGKKGLGYNDKGFYDSQALKGWTMCGTYTNPDTPVALSAPGEAGTMKNVEWQKTVKDEKGNEEVLVMREDGMGKFEKKILEMWPEIEDGFDQVMPGDHSRSVRRASTAPVTVGEGGSTGVEVRTPDAGRRVVGANGNVVDGRVETTVDGVRVDIHPNRIGTL